MLMPLLVFGVIGWRRWQQSGGFPSGVDAGNWFAVGRGYFGEGGKSTNSPTGPLMPIMLHLGQTVADPLLVATIFGVGSLLAIVAATYLLALDKIEPWLAIAVATMVGLASAVTEPMTFGGYPQNYAFSFLIVGSWQFARYLQGEQRRSLSWAVLMWSGAAVTHHMYFALAGFVAAVVWLIWITTKPTRMLALRQTLASASAGIIACLCFLPTYLAMRNANYTPPINAGGLELTAAIHYGIREAPWLWMLVFASGAGFLAATYRQRGEVTWQVATSLMVVSALLVSFTAETRLLPPLTVGACLAGGLALQAAWCSQRSAWKGMAVALALALPLMLWPQSEATATMYYRYYRVVDQALLDAAAYIDDNHGTGFVAVRENSRGWPIGWWFEGLVGARVAVGSNEKWLAYPDERKQARLVNRFFDRSLTGPQVVALAANENVDFLVVRKREWIGWERWLAEPNAVVRVAYDNGEFIILDVRQS